MTVASWDEVFYPDGVGAWMASFDADTESARPARCVRSNLFVVDLCSLPFADSRLVQRL